MKNVLIATLLIASTVAAEPQVQESMTPLVKKDSNKVEFTVTTQTMQPISVSLDDLVEKKLAIESDIAKLQAQLTKISQLVDQAKALGVKTISELEVERQAEIDAKEAIDAAAVTVKTPTP